MWLGVFYKLFSGCKACQDSQEKHGFHFCNVFGWKFCVQDETSLVNPHHFFSKKNNANNSELTRCDPVHKVLDQLNLNILFETNYWNQTDCIYLSWHHGDSYSCAYHLCLLIVSCFCFTFLIFCLFSLLFPYNSGLKAYLLSLLLSRSFLPSTAFLSTVCRVDQKALFESGGFITIIVKAMFELGLTLLWQKLSCTWLHYFCLPTAFLSTACRVHQKALFELSPLLSPKLSPTGTVVVAKIELHMTALFWLLAECAKKPYFR